MSISTRFTASTTHTPIEETLEALNDVVRAGKALYIGASSMYAWQFQRMLHVSDERGLARFVTMQNHYNLVYREEEREMIPLCRAEGIGLIPWSPLARGFLAGNRSKQDFGETVRAKTDDYAKGLYYRDSDFTVVERVTEIAKKRGVSNAQVALAWMLQSPRSLLRLSGRARCIIWTMHSMRLNCISTPKRSRRSKSRTSRIQCWDTTKKLGSAFGDQSLMLRTIANTNRLFAPTLLPVQGSAGRAASAAGNSSCRFAPVRAAVQKRRTVQP